MRSKVFRITKLLALLVLALAVVTIIGCKKKTADEPAVQAQTEEIVQKTCPVMVGNPINKNIFVEYQGKKVYFCCNDCKAKFQADPEKYLGNLPQFKDQAESMKKQAEQTVDKTSDEMKKAAENTPDM
jgi:YHS domain-containing protein